MTQVAQKQVITRDALLSLIVLRISEATLKGEYRAEEDLRILLDETISEFDKRPLEDTYNDLWSMRSGE